MEEMDNINIPDKVKIGGVVYDVIITNKPDKSDKNTNGLISYSSGTIAISNGFDECKDYQEFVLIHEIVHGILWHMGIEQNEELTDKIAKGLQMVIKDNPEMFK